ncbi:MAG TPA: DivIVA domain-containing protein [Acidimicrobiales bacterium]|nr:DivIVA domain-containing protein [Acidimicrobiales bacterium]
MGDDNIVISSGQVVTPENVMSRSFTSAFRGYHPAEVKQFLKRVSDEMAASQSREADLRRALEEALHRAAHPQLDEATLTNLLGEHAARLLASARETAASIVGEAQQQAAAILHDAEQRMARMRDEAEGLMARRVAEADATAASILHAARVEAEAQIESATQQGKDMVVEARAVRERMLGDLARRRRTAQVQVEQLRAARDRLLAAHDVVRRTVEEATAELEASEEEARMAAEAVADRAEDSTPRREAPLPVRTAEPRPPAVTATAEPERAMALVATAVASPVRERHEPAVPPAAVFRRMEEKRPLPPERPPLRPQTVAAAVAGRMPAALAPPERPPPDPPAAPPAPTASGPPVVAPAAPRRPIPVPAPAAPLALPSEPPIPSANVLGPASSSDLATSEVPTITGDAPPGDVEQLFARLRADSDQPDLNEPLTGLFDPEPAPPPPEPPAVDAVVSESALEGRDDLLDNLEAGLTRALKRVLGDEQNEILDSLRRLGPSAGIGVLPDSDAQRAAYRDAALPWLQQAARAGVGFVSDPESGSHAEAGHPSLDAQAEVLARELVEPLRERLSRAVVGGPDADDPSVAAESLRATYRQWKVQHVEDCARHHVVASFNLGAFAATPDVATLRWLVDDDGHCPDCDDNALAGPTPKGQPFPTGQLHPPAHPGCRCLLVAVTA